MNTTVGDVMTAKVYSVPATAGFREMVELIETHHVSALPVVDDQDHVLGVVSEADLLLKEEQNELNVPHLVETRKQRLERVKAAGATAKELMTAPAITVGPQAPVRTAARLMRERRVKRLPVVSWTGKLVGIVTRGDVLKVFMRDDEQIRREIVDYVIGGLLLLDRSAVTVEVVDGVVSLKGHVDRMADARMLPGLCRAVDGVVSVDSQLAYRFKDDSRHEHPGVVSTP
jgi:CBS domain-containing protein